MKNLNRKISILITMALLSCMFITLSSVTVTAGDVYNSAGTPVNASTVTTGTNITLSVTITTKTGQPISQNFTTNVSGAWATIGTNILDTNGTNTDYLTGFTAYTAKYFWASNVSNDNATREWDNNTYFFYTRAASDDGTTGQTGSTEDITPILDTTSEPTTTTPIQIDTNKVVISVIIFAIVYFVMTKFSIPIPVKVHPAVIPAVLAVLYYIFI